MHRYMHQHQRTRPPSHPAQVLRPQHPETATADVFVAVHVSSTIGVAMPHHAPVQSCPSFLLVQQVKLQVLLIPSSASPRASGEMSM